MAENFCPFFSFLPQQQARVGWDPSPPGVATLAEMKNWSRKRFGLDGVFNVEDSSHCKRDKKGLLGLIIT